MNEIDNAVDLGFESRHYTSDGLDLHALVRDGRGPAVVMLHGAASNALAFLPILEAFEGRRLICVDLPGHGASAPVHDWTLAPLARRISDAIAGREPGGLIWGGHSWGGKIAAVLAGVTPERARGLVLVDPSPASPVPVTAEAFVASSLEPEIGPWADLDDAIATVRKLPQYAHWRPEIERAFRRGVRALADGGVGGHTRRDWLVEISEATLLRDETEHLARIACPTLLVFAQESLFWQEPTNAKAFEAVPGTESVTLPGNHWLMFEPPAALVRTLRDWLDENADR